MVLGAAELVAASLQHFPLSPNGLLFYVSVQTPLFLKEVSFSFQTPIKRGCGLGLSPGLGLV